MEKMLKIPEISTNTILTKTKKKNMFLVLTSEKSFFRNLHTVKLFFFQRDNSPKKSISESQETPSSFPSLPKKPCGEANETLNDLMFRKFRETSLKHV